ncbi:MAG: endonuclease/exonuclease/phosphatase family protein [Cyclobacteriaceae bacterium]
MTLALLSLLLLIVTIVPFKRKENQVIDFLTLIKPLILLSQLALFTLFIFKWNTLETIEKPVFALLLIAIIYHIIILSPYNRLYPKRKKKKNERASYPISLLTTAVKRSKKDKTSFTNVIKEHNPDIFLTLGSDKKWEDSFNELEKIYPHSVRVPKETRYGMHLYSKYRLDNVSINYSVYDDIPSISCTVQLGDTLSLDLHGIRSITMNENKRRESKEDELLKLGKELRTSTSPTLVFSRLHKVPWSRKVIDFKKASRLIDTKIGRSSATLLSHTPLNYLFHSSSIYITDVKSVKRKGLANSPQYAKFIIEKTLNTSQYRKS